MRDLVWVAFLLAALLFGMPGIAAEIEVPVGTQVELFVKILGYDRNLKARSGREIVLGVLYQPRYRVSLDTKDELLRQLAGVPSVEGLPLRAVPLELEEGTDLGAALAARGITTLYVCPLRAVRVESVSAAAGQRRVLTLTGVREDVGAGLAIGIGLKGDRPQILVNLRVARAAGADLDAQLLRLATVVR